MKWLLIGVLLLSCSKAPIKQEQVMDNPICFISSNRPNNFHITYDTCRYTLVKENNTLILKNK
jgi:hypothetical protein